MPNPLLLGRLCQNSRQRRIATEQKMRRSIISLWRSCMVLLSECEQTALGLFSGKLSDITRCLFSGEASALHWLVLLNEEADSTVSERINLCWALLSQSVDWSLISVC